MFADISRRRTPEGSYLPGKFRWGTSSARLRPRSRTPSSADASGASEI